VPLTFTFAGLSDIGLVRRRNEDHFAVAETHGIAVVADGMGGHPGGDVASRLAAEIVARRLTELLAATAADDQGTASVLGHAIAQSVLDAHALLRMEAARQPSLQGMGTTVTALAMDRHAGAYAIGHVGDSRAYRLRDGKLSQLTQDDTWVRQRVEAGDFTEAQADGHPFGHLLSQCLGADEPPEPHIIAGTAEAGDIYLLCTDGLTGVMDLEALKEAIQPQPSLQEAAGELVAQAKSRGSRDNITAVLIGVTG